MGTLEKLEISSQGKIYYITFQFSFADLCFSIFFLKTLLFRVQDE